MKYKMVCGDHYGKHDQVYHDHRALDGFVFSSPETMAAIRFTDPYYCDCRFEAVKGADKAGTRSPTLVEAGQPINVTVNWTGCECKERPADSVRQEIQSILGEFGWQYINASQALDGIMELLGACRCGDIDKDEQKLYCIAVDADGQVYVKWVNTSLHHFGVTVHINTALTFHSGASARTVARMLKRLFPEKNFRAVRVCG